ncbi:uncharacterized protein KQ657_003717 [Scheffersomyces spartinae]|uniref:Uncharacterized protein n=1 Tax=Scheffersomyces spartinae TaxID=45513 RepID=A0A9P7VC65_9ASCO|nr:uncharacterized protein KQ657_003717 [Scheffersomyces spartinae]KAG7195192.1 hypothetical protein KQ657_003717 [Scheffersomyces spartinae]
MAIPKKSVAVTEKPKKTPEATEKSPESDEKHSNISKVQFRILAGSYEHNLLCLSVLVDPKNTKQPIFQPIFHFQAHALSIKSIDVAKRYLVTGSNDEHIRIYDLQKRKELGTLLSHQGTVTTLKFSKTAKEASNETEDESSTKSGKWLLSGSEDGKIIIWRTKDWEVFGTLKGHTGRINDLDIHPSGRVAISVSQDQTIRLWNLMTVKKAAVLKIKGRDHLGQNGEFVRWSINGTHFLVGLLDKLLVYKTQDAKICKKIKFKSTLMCIEIIEIDGTEWIVTGHSNGSIDFYDFKNQIIPDDSNNDEVEDADADFVTPTFSLQGHANRIKDLSFYKDNAETGGIPYLVSVSSDGKIVVWDLTKSVRDQVAVYDSGERLNCVVVSPESVEKSSTMKRRYNEIDTEGAFSESEYETDGEEIKKVLKAATKKGRKGKKSKRVSVQLE